MCDICKELVECPIGEKRKVWFQLPDKDTFTDFYGRKFVIEGPWFVIDKYPDHTECHIGGYYYDENSVGYGWGIDSIRFCPFCGQELVPVDRVKVSV